MMFTSGPKMTWLPVFAASSPTTAPYAYASCGSNVAASAIGAGICVDLPGATSPICIVAQRRRWLLVNADRAVVQVQVRDAQPRDAGHVAGVAAGVAGAGHEPELL